jgi:hypothetical protein
MLSCFVGLWMAAAVGQAPAEAEWLESVPADIPIVIRFRSPEAITGDLLAMLKAMSPAAAEAGRNWIEPQLREFEATFGAAVGRNPELILLHLPDPARPDVLVWGLFVKTGDPAAVIAAVSRDGGEKPKSLDGYQSFPAKEGQTWYATKGSGWVAFGPDEAMIKAIHRPRASLAEALSPEVKARFLAGDVGLCLSIAAVQKKYGDFIEQIKPKLLAQVEQAPNARGARGVENTKQLVDGLIEALKAGDRLALSLDFDAAGLTFSGLATVKGGSPAAERLARARTGSGRLLEKLPGDKMIYGYAADSPGSPNGQPKPGAGPATSPAVEKAAAARSRALEGRLVFGVTLMPMQFLSLADPRDPQAAVTATLEANRARQSEEKEKSTIEPNALTYAGFQLARSKTEFDPQQIARNAGNQLPNSDQVLGKMFAGKTLITYTGTDGKLFLEATAASEDQIKAQIDAVKDASHNLGALASWKALRAKLPEQATVLVLLSAQETVKMLLTAVGAMSNNEGIKPPADLPRATALLGFALVASPKGYDFRLVIPSDVGPVFEKGLAPLGRRE